MQIDLRQSPNYGHFMEKIGWLVGRKDGFQFYIRHFPILGNFIKIPRPQNQISPKTLDNLAKKYRAFAVRVDWSPTKTITLDLTKSLEQIQNQMKKDARYELRKAEKNKILIKDSRDIETFIKMWHKNAWHRGFWIPIKREIQAIWEAFGKDAFIIEAVRGGTKFCQERKGVFFVPLAGALILIHDRTAHYFHAASTPEGRKLSAPYLVVWEAIKETKKRGCQIFDFEGIYDERFPQKSWLGFTHFKKSFGGKEIEFPGPFIRFYNPIFSLIARLHRLI